MHENEAENSKMIQKSLAAVVYIELIYLNTTCHISIGRSVALASDCEENGF